MSTAGPNAAVQKGQDALPRPHRPRVSAGAMLSLHRLLEPNRLWYRFSLFLESRPALNRGFTWMERRFKGELFGCQMCGQCALPTTGYACPETCPKHLRNGPCGGASFHGRCEVYPEMDCVWVLAYDRLAAENRTGDLRRLLRPIDHERWGQSAWTNYWLGRQGDLWTEGPEPEADATPALKQA